MALALEMEDDKVINGAVGGGSMEQKTAEMPLEIMAEGCPRMIHICSGQTGKKSAGTGGPAGEYGRQYPIRQPNVRIGKLRIVRNAGLGNRHHDRPVRSSAGFLHDLCDTEHPILPGAGFDSASGLQRPWRESNRFPRFLCSAAHDNIPLNRVVRRHADRVCRMSVDDPAIVLDMDTPDDYQRLLSLAAEQVSPGMA